MPVMLYHGPANPKKRERILELTQSCEENSWLLVLPHKMACQEYRRALAKKSKNQILLGENCITFDDFLQLLLKINHQRIHKADEIMGTYLLFLLLEPDARSNSELSHLRALFTFFCHIKKCGYTPQLAKKKLSSCLTNPKLLDVFALYQSHLQNIFHLDSGDLYLTLFDLLKSPSFEFFPHVQHLIFAENYPLHIGQREMIRRLKKYQPTLQISLFYDEDFSRLDDLLSQSYEDLGDLSDHSEFINSAPLKLVPLLSFPNPYEEMLAVVQSLKQNKLSWHNFMIVTTPSYVDHLLPLLEEHHIPYANLFPQTVAQILGPQTRTQTLNQLKENLPSLIKDNQNALTQTHRALNCLQELEENSIFLKSLFQELNQNISASKQEAFFKNWADLIGFHDHFGENKVLICNSDQARCLWPRNGVFLGLNQECCLTTPEVQIYSHDVMNQKELAELLISPSYQIKINLEKITQVFQGHPDFIATRSATDFTNRPTTLLALPQIKWHETTITPPQTPAVKISRDYPKVDKKKFSVTELQTYLDCPFKYYASSGLKLGKLETEELEPEAGVRGNFVHQVLCDFLTGHLDLYQSAIKNTDGETKFLNELSHFLKDQAKIFPHWQDKEKNLIEKFVERAEKTLFCFFIKEFDLYRKNNKKTFPRFFEWQLKDKKTTGFPFLIDGETFTITGRIDRIDVDEENKNFTIIDYKTGDASSTHEILALNSIPLPFYTMAVQKLLLPDFAPSASLYYQLKENKIQGFATQDTADEKILKKNYVITKETAQDLITSLQTKITNTIRKIHMGAFDPSPSKTSLCLTCDYRHICGFLPNESDDESDT